MIGGQGKLRDQGHFCVPLPNFCFLYNIIDPSQHLTTNNEKEKNWNSELINY